MFDADVIQKISFDMDILLNIFHKEFYAEYVDLSVSLSAGVTFSDENSKTFDDLYLEADKALYASKGNGKNRYTIYEKEV